jgi:hypothetical protein
MKDNFDIHSWNHKRYLNEAGEGTTKANLLATAINDAMIEIDDSMSYKDFASAVATILKDEYGTHVFALFMEVLHAELGIEEESNRNVVDEAEEKEYEVGFWIYRNDNYDDDYVKVMAKSEEEALAKAKEENYRGKNFKIYKR